MNIIAYVLPPHVGNHLAPFFSDHVFNRTVVNWHYNFSLSTVRLLTINLHLSLASRSISPYRQSITDIGLFSLSEMFSNCYRHSCYTCIEYSLDSIKVLVQYTEVYICIWLRTNVVHHSQTSICSVNRKYTLGIWWWIILNCLDEECKCSLDECVDQYHHHNLTLSTVCDGTSIITFLDSRRGNIFGSVCVCVSVCLSIRWTYVPRIQQTPSSYHIEPSDGFAGQGHRVMVTMFKNVNFKVNVTIIGSRS